MPTCLCLSNQTPWIPPKSKEECDDTFSRSPLDQTGLGNTDPSLASFVPRIMPPVHAILITLTRGRVLVNCYLLHKALKNLVCIEQPLSSSGYCC